MEKLSIITQVTKIQFRHKITKSSWHAVKPNKFWFILCDTMCVIRFCGCGCQSEDSFVCFWRETHTKGLQARSPTRPEEDEGRKVPELKRSQSTGESSQEKVAVKRWELVREETSQQKSERRLLRPVDRQMPVWPTREDKSALLVTCGSFARVHAHVSPLKHRMHKSVTNFSLLALGANPSPWLFVLLFFHPLGCVCCVLCVGK